MDKTKSKPVGVIRGMFQPVVFWNAIKVSLVVGTILNLVNQGQRVWAGQGVLLGHALLNFLVPFLVSAYSGAKAKSGGSLIDSGDSHQEER